MATSSKVLTVTYGTFSCTLEGFDDPFTTLQMVAEYFRKLAAEDRYFGGTPQTPDAEMLRQIAEDSSPRNVNAELADDGIILRQTDATPLNDGIAEQETTFSQDRSQDGVASDTPSEVEFAQAAAVELTGEHPGAEATAETTAETTDEAADEPAGEPEVADSPDWNENDIEPEAAGEIEAVVEHEETAEEIESADRPALADGHPDTQADTQADSDGVESEVEPADANDAAIDAANDDDTAESTPDIVEQTDAPMDSIEAPEIAVEDGLEDITPEAPLDADETNQRAEQIEQPQIEETVPAEPSDTLAAETALETQETDEETVIRTPLTFFHSSRTKDTNSSKMDDDGDEDASAAARPTSVEETLAAIRRNVRQAETEDEQQEDEAVSATDDIGDNDETDAATGPAEEPLVLKDAIAPPPLYEERDSALLVAAAMDQAEDQAAETPLHETDPTPAADESAEERVAEQTEEAEAEAEHETASTSLSDEDEADLQRELDETLTGETSEEETPEAAVEESPDAEAHARREQHRARAKTLRGPDDLEREEAALDRLLETTRTKMDKPEQVRRVNALDQLKAAVAATEAEQKFQGRTLDDDSETADLAAYREDLRRAHSNARLGGLGTSETAQTPATQAPLILVSEQRVDGQKFENEEQATPESTTREVAETDGNLALKRAPETKSVSDDNGEIQGIPSDAFDTSNTFRDFAERIGAFELQDLLEAAAAYTSIIEGKPRFSRAQVMSKIARLDTNDAFSKEAGLRSFGRLLREGKILRVQDGQFAISKASRFSIASRQED